MIRIKHTGNFYRTEKFFSRALQNKARFILESYGKQGVAALASATPKDTGETASSWDYEITVTNRGYRINWFNTNINDGVSIVILLQYGHGTGSGGYVQGRDFINPAIRPIFDKIAEDLYKEVTNL